MTDALSAPNSRVIEDVATDSQIHWPMAMVGALLAHVALLVALTVSVNWTQTQQPVVFEAELVSAVIEQAAPRAAPKPPSAPPPKPEPQPAPPPPPVTPPALEPTQPSAADIALEKEKVEREKADEEKATREKAAKEKAAKEKAAKEKAAREKAAKKKAAREKAAKEKAAKEKAAREKAAREKAAKEKAAKEKAAREKAAREKAEAERQEAILKQMRAEQMARTADLVGLDSNANAQGTAAKSKGPSATYGAKVDAAVRPNIVFGGVVRGNPPALVEVTAAPGGEIIGRKLLRSSGVAAWDQAVLRGLDRTGRLPKDEDGTVPSPLIINFYPKK